jgi:hypothetical protein
MTRISRGRGTDWVFDIRFQEAKSASSEELAVGTIVLGSFRETFESPLHVWAREDYERHWVQALERLLDGSESTALTTELYDPATANFIRWWPAYRFGNEVRFQNQLLLLADLPSALEPSDPFGHVSPYRQTNEDGDRLSEWPVPLDDLYRFLDRPRDLRPSQ